MPEERVDLSRAWVKMDPLDDEAQHALIESLAAAGQRVAALDQYESYKALIAGELEVGPLDHTKELVERIRHGQPVSLTDTFPDKERGRRVAEIRGSSDLAMPEDDQIPRVKCVRRIEAKG